MNRSPLFPVLFDSVMALRSTKTQYCYEKHEPIQAQNLSFLEYQSDCKNYHGHGKNDRIFDSVEELIIFGRDLRLDVMI